MTVTKIHEAVMEMTLVGGSQGLSSGCAPDHSEEKIDDRNSEDQQRYR